MGVTCYWCWTSIISWFDNFCSSSYQAHIGSNVNIRINQTSKVIEWTDALKEDFNNVKQAFASAPILCYPDYKKPFYIACDASNLGVGGVLYQPDEGKEEITPTNIVAICSKKLNTSQQRYSVYKKELYGIVYSLRKFHSYIWGRLDNVLYTDHKPLTYLFKSTNLCVALQQWLDIILDYTFAIRYREGVLNVLPDMLSRMYVAAYRDGKWGVGNIISSNDLADAADIEIGGKRLLREAIDINIDVKNVVLSDEDQKDMGLSDLKGEEVADEPQLTKEERIKLIQSEHLLGHFGKKRL